MVIDKEKTILNEETSGRVRTLILQGKENKEIQEILQIPEGTWSTLYYRNQHGFRDLVNKAREERMVRTAEEEMRKLQTDKDSKIRLQANVFLLETLGKDRFSKKTETENTIKVETVKEINYIKPKEQKEIKEAEIVKGSTEPQKILSTT